MKTKGVYAGLGEQELILRDHLARDRTVLANERTLLSYLRTAIAVLAAGATLIKVFPEDGRLIGLGVALLVGGVGLAGVGVARFVTVARRLRPLIPDEAGGGAEGDSGESAS